MPSPPNPSEVAIVLPELGVAPIKLSAWLADVGDDVYEGDRVVEVSVAGATFDVASPATGRLAVQHVVPRDEIFPGQVLGIVETSE